MVVKKVEKNSELEFTDNYEKMKVKKSKKRKCDQEFIEDKYEEIREKINENEGNKRIRYLLPLKTKDGSIKKQVIEEEIEDEEEEQQNLSENDNNDNEVENDSDNEFIESFKMKKQNVKTKKEMTDIELMAHRSRLLNERRIKIGLTASSILENPELKINNFTILLDFMEEKTPGIDITIKKLATVSLLEVFKDILPSYHLHQLKQEGVKHKKETFQLQNYEASLLRNYKNYLQKLEKLAEKLRKKKGDTRIVAEPEMQLGELAITCMCDLLSSNPYFNYSSNIANFLIPYLNNKRQNVREIIAKCFSQLFKEDKKAELTLTIVRKLNQFIKSKEYSLHTEALSVLLSLRIRNVNLDKERDDELKQKKLMSHKQRILALSKRERKKNKKLEEVEKELLETKAEENKAQAHKILTEITTIVFTIYFRVIKNAPNSKILSACLEGLAKFAHCINLDFYQDLVNAINKLLAEGNLGQREQLHCIQTVFTILSGHGSSLTIDPHRFYSHLYKILPNIDLGRNQENCEIVIQCLTQALINRRRRVTQARLVSFIKRISMITLQLQHHGSLGLLGIVKKLFQLCKTAEILLDTDNNVGDGTYQPELDDPEYCNAHRAALWELIALQRHYHCIVQRMAKNITYNVPTTGEGSLNPEIAKLSPEELYSQYDPSEVVFNPAVQIPKKHTAKTSVTFSGHFIDGKFDDYVQEMKDKRLSTIESLDFYKAIKTK
ncbi:nucleolar complex protein 3 homolog [Microplitis mediator]|uniref:nucleolar complex protein 3 homolog n=1 Tax=Microplitis mediator TaxID=375433 RepID=UPI0025573E3E|nr:nucleolar complex protein 3 homolog [Microplitis mediator]